MGITRVKEIQEINEKLLSKWLNKNSKNRTVLYYYYLVYYTTITTYTILLLLRILYYYYCVYYTTTEWMVSSSKTPYNQSIHSDHYFYFFSKHRTGVNGQLEMLSQPIIFKVLVNFHKVGRTSLTLNLKSGGKELELFCCCSFFDRISSKNISKVKGISKMT